MKKTAKRIIAALLAAVTVTAVSTTAFASVSYMPDVTAEMSNAGFWAALDEEPDRVLMTRDEMKAQNADTAKASGTMVMDLKSAPAVFDGLRQNELIASSAKSDAEYYYGWTYGPDGKAADWSYFQKMIDNCIDPKAKKEQPVRFGVAVKRTVMQVFPSPNPLWDDPADKDFNYYALSGVRVNEPVVIYTTSADGKYYLARISCCSGWIPAEDVAVCSDRQEWLSAWDIPDDEILVVYGNKVYTDESFTHPETAKRMLTFGTKLRSVDPASVSGLVGNRSAYHNYIVELPIRTDDGGYAKSLALIPETAKVHEGYLPLTKRNIAAAILNNLGDAYGWGGMMDVEDCSSLVRLTYECFGLDVARNGNWQWAMNVAKLDMTYMTVEEKCRVLDELPLGTALCFSGHEMMYLGKYGGKYYVVSTVSSMMDPYEPGSRLRVRDVTINTLDVKRANGKSWLQELNHVFMLGYGDLAAGPFDFPEEPWYYDSVAFCVKNKIFSADSNGLSGLMETATRADTVSALRTLAGKPESSAETPFTDVPDKIKTDVSWAYETGVMLGVSETEFAPDMSLTREQLVTILYRFAVSQGMDVSAGESADLGGFSDLSSLSEYAVPAMKWAFAAGIIRGNDDGTLAPRAETTRVQAAAIMQRYGTM